MMRTHLRLRGLFTTILLASAPALFSAGCSVDVEEDGAAQGENIATDSAALFPNVFTLWPSDVIPVCWENPTPANAAERDWVRTAVRDSWDAESSVDFIGWGMCNFGSDGIRILIADDGPHTKGLGTQLDGMLFGMVLNFTFQNWSTDCQNSKKFCIEAIAVHEFGHALGFAHEQNRPDTPSWCDEEQGSDGNMVIGSWDLDSVMNYCNPEWNGDGELSETDIDGVRMLYGAGAFTASSLWNGWFSLAGEVPLIGDFNEDGRDDIVTFTQGSGADVWVALSSGAAFGAGALWHSWFAPAGETPRVGDFNGDGKDDIVTFTQGTTADVWVALSNGAGFAASSKWNASFAPAGYTPQVGDFNGDGKDDIISFSQGSTGDVWVSLSTGAGFSAAVKWHGWFAPDGEIPMAGDFNGDGKDDIVSFTQNGTGDVYVALSSGVGFVAAAVWHGWFSPAGETPGVGDFNNDGKDDIVTFTQGGTADVYVAFSNGAEFGDSSVWNGSFAPAGQIPRVGDFNGDGQDDIARFTQGGTADVYVSTAQ
jgi:hypothetical protein